MSGGCKDMKNAYCRSVLSRVVLMRDKTVFCKMCFEGEVRDTAKISSFTKKLVDFCWSPLK